MGSYSVVQCLRRLMGQPLYCSAPDAGVWGERGAMVMAPPAMCDSAVSPCFHGCLASLHRHFPPQSPTSHPRDPSLHSQQQPSPQSPNSSSQHCTFHGTCIPVQGLYGCGKDCLILIPFQLSQISSLTLSLKCFSSDVDNCPSVGIRPLLQFHHPPREVQSY